MNALEAMFWRAERDPLMRPVVMAVELLDHAPDWDDVLGAHRRLVEAAPGLRRRVVDSRTGGPVWQDDPYFDLDYHLRRVRVPAPGTRREVLDLAQTWAMTPFDRARPLWEATLVEGLADGAAYVMKLHHSLCDGLAAAQLLAMLHTPVPGGGMPGEPAERPEYELPGLPRVPERDEAVSVRSRVAHPVRSIGAAVRFGETVLRATVVPVAPPSPLLARRGRSWRFESLTLPADELRLIGKRTGGSMNDVYLALLLGAFRRYHEHFGPIPASLPVLIPISTRSATSARGGNEFASSRVSGPMHTGDFGERVRLVRAEISIVRRAGTLRALEVLARSTRPLPPALVVLVAKSLFQGNDLLASNFPGVPRRVRLGDAEVLEVLPFAPVIRGAATTVMVSYAGNCHIGVNLDPEAVTDPALFLDCFHEEWDDAKAG
ncbi:WS/DGAT/MGAT family acyltransferase [Saccharothrix tamanrassetensis]|uniref:diacylglycerol O-acyltransferase n=1 Tax=Saccharothrix tamanrassetensis TaxID=1051531 RepID=A0A841CRC5_9PSEU|nr:wax ester/triacylglycerol synthase domain-containing protein [Saccharothrix tamanrassetensis]MBB5959790.1 WS/DGAT/MGAT family acyltransferase [Saccharothrix tamanrassetensis]